MLAFHANLLLLGALGSVSRAALPSVCGKTSQGLRAGLNESAFRIDTLSAPRTDRPGSQVFVAGLEQYPALGVADLQWTLAVLYIESGKTFPTHIHPRSSETLTVVDGRARISFVEESGRKVSNVFTRFQTAIIPQGLPHTSTCIGEETCRLSVTFNSADPGTVFI